MAKTRPFEQYASAYDRWFEDHPAVYESELEALRTLIPEQGFGLEVGTGTGRFAAPLGVALGVEPSRVMREIARSRNVEVVAGTAEALPFPDECVDYILFVTTICFLDSLGKAFSEAYRVLKPAGLILVGFIDKNSLLGRDYEKRKHESRFCRDAVFRSVDEVSSCLVKAGFGALRFVQTVFQPMAQITAAEPLRNGYGKGAFVVARAAKKNSPALMT